MNSKFIDTPSGLLNLNIRRFSHTSTQFPHDRAYLKLEIMSRVKRDNVLAYNMTAEGGTGSMIKEAYQTQMLSFYKVEEPSRRNDSAITRITAP